MASLGHHGTPVSLCLIQCSFTFNTLPKLGMACFWGIYLWTTEIQDT